MARAGSAAPAGGCPRRHSGRTLAAPRLRRLAAARLTRRTRPAAPASPRRAQIAKRQGVVNPENTFYSVKRFIGRRMDEVAEESKARSRAAPAPAPRSQGGKRGDHCALTRAPRHPRPPFRRFRTTLPATALGT